MQADGKMSGSFCTCSWKSVLTFDKDVLCKNLSLFKLLILFVGLIWMSSDFHFHQLILNSWSGPWGMGLGSCGDLGEMGSDKQAWGHRGQVYAGSTFVGKPQMPCYPAIKLPSKMNSSSQFSHWLVIGILLQPHEK